MGDAGVRAAERAAAAAGEEEGEDSGPACVTVAFAGRRARLRLERTETDVFMRAALLPLRVFDPHLYHTAAGVSAVSRADSERGKLYFRGYDMEELAARSNFLEVAYLLIYGRGLPTQKAADLWSSQVLSHANLHEDIRNQLRTFRYDAHPMGMLISTFAALSTFHPEANPSLHGADMYSKSDAITNKQIFRILGKVITTAACTYRVRLGRPFNLPEPADRATYAENFLSMLDRLSEPAYRSHPALPAMLDRLFVALADDGMNSAAGLLCHVASSKVDPYTAMSAAFAAAYGARISGVGDAVLAMLAEIGTPAAVPDFVAHAKTSRRRLQGFGHLNYRAYDPRCRVVRQVALEAAQLMSTDPLLDVALALEAHVLADTYYTSRCVYPNVDLFLSLVFRMMGFPPDYFCVLVCIPRTAGWLAHWREGLMDKSARIARPRQIYTGPPKRAYVALEERKLRTDVPAPKLGIPPSSSSARRRVSCGPSMIPDGRVHGNPR